MCSRRQFAEPSDLHSDPLFFVYAAAYRANRATLADERTNLELRFRKILRSSWKDSFYHSMLYSIELERWEASSGFIDQRNRVSRINRDVTGRGFDAYR